MDEMIEGLRFDSKVFARMGKEGGFMDETGLAIHNCCRSWDSGCTGHHTPKSSYYSLYFPMCLSISIIKSFKNINHDKVPG